ncbi:hypothetical protein GCM10027446_20250 [Angustibacter peucedani]
MSLRFRSRPTWAAAAATSAAALALTGLSAVSAQAAPSRSTARPGSDVRDISAATRKMALTAQQRSQLKSQAVAPNARARTALAAGVTPPAGTQRTYYVLDDFNGGYVPQTFTLKKVGTNIEVWVQDDLNYPAGDCRNDGVRNVVTQAQVDDLANQFDTNMLPKESQAFSVAPPRDGANAQVGAPGYYSGDGDKTVALISNVRDANFYEPNTPDGATYIAGFFSPTFNEAYDRNVMTIDSYDWLHRTGANPPNQTPGGLCSPNQAARPRLYEGTFAHEYQHLLHYYTDGDETTWLNEGLSDYAQTLVGYVDTRLRWPATGADSHIACFQGFYATDDFPYCGAENSLTQWEDQGSPSVLSDYGAAYSFVTYVADHFGLDAISRLHRDAKNGLASVQDMLDDEAPGLSSSDVVHDWAAAMAVDGWLDGGAKGLKRDDKARFSSKQLSSGIDWAWPGSYDSPGAPPNGSDYVLAKDGRPVTGRTAKSLSFAGAVTYAPDPVEWVVDATAHDGPALYAGEGDELDRSLVYSVNVPSGSPKLSFATKYDIEEGWDFGLVQVSTDGGKTYKSLSNASTTSEHDPAASGAIVSQLPGFTGVSDWTTQTFDLAPYAGKAIKLSFRYMTDEASNGNGGDGPTGWWVDDVKVGSTTITDGSSLAGAKSATQVYPTPVEAWNVQVVGWTLDGKRVAYQELKLTKGAGSLNAGQLKKTFKKSDRIGVIVGLDDSKEAARKYATYTLKINGTRQPGGR